jgi:pilus assembly protein Flp/PilA
VRLRDEDGASAVEYGLMLAAIAAVLLVVLIAFGSNVTGLFTKTCDSVAESADPATTC